MQTASMSARTTGALLAVGAAFGSSFLLVKLLVGEMSPAQLTAWRLLIGGVAMMGILAVRGGMRAPSMSLAGRATVLAMLDSVVPNTLLAWAQIRVDSGIAAVLISSMPLFTVLFAMLLPRRDSLTHVQLFGIVLGIAGVALLVGADAQNAASGAPAGHLAVILGATSQAAAVVYARAVVARDDAMQLSTVKLLTGAAIAMALAAVVDDGHVAPAIGPGAWVTLVLLALASNAFARTLYLWLIATAGSVRASLVAYIVPMVAVMLGWLVLGEQLSAGAMAGMAVIVGGMAMVTHGTSISVRLPRRSLRHIETAPHAPTQPRAA